MARILALLLVVVWGLFAAGWSQAADETPRQAIDAVRATLTDIENALKDDNLTDSELVRLRALNDPLGVKLQAIILDLTPGLEASRKRLAELKPKTADAKARDAAPATDSASDEIKDEQAKYDALDADLRSARALLLQSDDDAGRIAAARRALFARQTFARSSSVLSPGLWRAVVNEAPVDFSSIGIVFSGATRDLRQRLSQTQALGFIAFVLALVAVSAPIRWLARRVIARDSTVASPTRLRRALAALWTLIVLAGAPLAMLWALAYALDGFDISDPRLQGIVDAALDALRSVAVANAFGRALIAPGESNWRLFSFSGRTATLLFRFLIFAAAIWGLQRLLEAIAELTASLTLSVAARAVVALIIGLAAAGTLRRMVDLRAESLPARDPWAPARTFGWMFAAALIASTLLGYIAFAAFLINQAFFVSAVGGALFLADVIVQESADEFLKPDAAFGRGVMSIVGLRRDTAEQAVVVIQAFARVAAIVAAVVVAFAPIGLPSQDLVSTLRSIYFGYTIGGVTISLSSLFAASIVFFLAVIVTRAAQNWLSDRYLPRTKLDPSVGNSIRTITGYIGLVIALLLGGTRLGVDLRQFEIIAGALSVGIGFGLQGIVNNFVSGLILLWERGIRVGDWVVVGAEQGFVRQINARATEIETFERATLIVPNSTLVTGQVKNWMRADRVGRILVNVNVEFDSDVEKVRELMIAAAKAQESILGIPAPLALFTDFGDWALKFQLICYVDDALMGERVRSEVNFDLLKRLREAGVRLAAPYPPQK